MISSLESLKKPGGTASWSDAGTAYHPVPWAFFFWHANTPLPPPKKKVHRDSFRFLFLSLVFFGRFFFNLKVLLEEFGLYGRWSYCFECFIGFLCPFLFGLGGYRAMGVFRMISDWIPLQVMYKGQLRLEHWRSCLPSAIILASSHSSLGMQILLYSSRTLEDSNLNWMFCLFRRYHVSFLSLSVWFCGYWDLTKRDHERDLTRPHPKWFRIYLITSIWMIQVVYCLWMTYLDV